MSYLVNKLLILVWTRTGSPFPRLAVVLIVVHGTFQLVSVVNREPSTLSFISFPIPSHVHLYVIPRISNLCFLGLNECDLSPGNL